MKILNNNKGFSLIELMIVVAIIGILAAVAIPNFQTFIRRSKQAEAKANLTIVYSAQRAFHGQWQFFHGYFEHIGFKPEGDLRYEVVTGAGTTVSNIYTTRKGGQITGTTVTASAYCAANPTLCLMDDSTVGAAVSCTPASADDTFTACASADLGGAAVDTWSVNQGKAITQTSVGE